MTRPKFKIGALGFGHLKGVNQGVAQWTSDRAEALEFDSEVEPKFLIDLLIEDPQAHMPKHAGIYVEMR